jgi:hypothetical protein
MDGKEIHGTVTRYIADDGAQIVETLSSGSSVRQKMVMVKRMLDSTIR